LFLLLLHHIVVGFGVLGSLAAAKLLLDIILEVIVDVEVGILSKLKHPVSGLHILVFLETGFLGIDS
jgi:hypothetical protein